MINIEEIQNCALTSQEIYDMINSCLEAAEDNGFLNQFVFERTLICHEVLLLVEDLDDIDGSMVAENPLTAFDHFLEMGYIQKLIQKQEATLNYVSRVAAQYFEDYEKYLLSIGGVLNKAEIFSSEVLQNMAGQVKEISENPDIQETLKIANEWGMNRQEAEKSEVLESLLSLSE